jgi:hypothetical protein
MVIGLIAIVFTPWVAALYLVPDATPEWSAATRWIGALAVAIGYAAFLVAKSPDRKLINVIMLSAVMTIIASLWSIFAGDGTLANFWYDLVIQLIVLITLLTVDTKVKPDAAGSA